MIKIRLPKKLGSIRMISFLPKFNRSGSIIIFTMLLLSVMLVIALTLSSIFIPKINLASKAKGSVGAIYAADSGIEWCLYVGLIKPSVTPAMPVMGNGATYSQNNLAETALNSSYCNTSPVKVIGNYLGVSRALEVSY